MSARPRAAVEPFRSAYASALADYLREPSEAMLHVAYELGRQAVSRNLSVLDLAVAHQEALLSALTGTPSSAVTRAAGDFFLESMSSFDMVQRGLAETRDAARHERRQTEMARQLSTFLADASLALDASGSLDEMLQLVAEQARELVGAECCVATVAADGQPRTAQAASYFQADRRWTAFVRWLDLFAVYRFVEQAGGSVRLAGEQLTDQAAFLTRPGDPPLHGWVAASLNALDGSELGAIQLFDKQDGGSFTADDEAALIHLAQMASAAVERARLYQDRGA
ncbi:MAG TPA: phosphatase RsbU N-terminal domain-containing protein [Thermoleophilaceae bacterium]|nr:phosphatase RsbU N-terminal domain-containing protein [Thermoleophilaceae bacterium]